MAAAYIYIHFFHKQAALINSLTHSPRPCPSPLKKPPAPSFWAPAMGFRNIPDIPICTTAYKICRVSLIKIKYNEEAAVQKDHPSSVWSAWQV
jgi:hypothetical protein